MEHGACGIHVIAYTRVMSHVVVAILLEVFQLTDGQTDRQADRRTDRFTHVGFM